jgi:hypothetical protein
MLHLQYCKGKYYLAIKTAIGTFICLPLWFIAYREAEIILERHQRIIPKNWNPQTNDQWKQIA